MKKSIFIIFLVISAFMKCYAENTFLLCRTLASVNLREGPSVDEAKICQVPKGSYFVAIVFNNDWDYTDGDFVYGLYVDKDIYGFVCVDYLDVEKELDTDKGGVLSEVGESYGYDPEVEITNATNRRITVQINGKNFPFKPREARTITCAPGSVSILASSPGVIPYSATDYVKENSSYTWRFYIETRYR